MRSSPFRAIESKTPDSGEATPQTAARLRPDKVRQLVTKGHLSVAQRDAADEIRTIMEALEIVMFPARSLEYSGGNKGGGSAPSTWLEKLSKTHYRIWLRKYSPWCAQMAETLGVGTRHELVVAIIIQGRGLRYASKQLCIPQRSAIKELKSALDLWWFI